MISHVLIVITFFKRPTTSKWLLLLNNLLILASLINLNCIQALKVIYSNKQYSIPFIQFNVFIFNLHWSCCHCAMLSLNIRCKIFIISIVVFCICHLYSKIMIMQIKKVVAKFKVKVCFVICLKVVWFVSQVWDVKTQVIMSITCSIIKKLNVHHLMQFETWNEKIHVIMSITCSIIKKPNAHASLVQYEEGDLFSPINFIFVVSFSNGKSITIVAPKDCEHEVPIVQFNTLQ